MKGRDWKCFECGAHFDFPMDVGSRTYWDPPEWVCPNCGDDIDMTDLWFECESCGEEFHAEDMENDEICKGCAEKAIQAMRGYMEDGVEMSQEDRDNFMFVWEGMN